MKRMRKKTHTFSTLNWKLGIGQLPQIECLRIAQVPQIENLELGFVRLN